ncbi:MAG: hypothetical protein ACLFTK_15140 [Anaerolineales bacterium]
MLTSIARPFQTGSAQAEVSGRLILAMLNHPEQVQMTTILPGLTPNIFQAHEWYKFQSFLDILRHLSDTLGSGAISYFVASGRACAAHIGPLASPASPEALIERLPRLYGLTVRHAPVGEGIMVARQTAQDYHIYDNTPWPDAAMYGFLWGLIQHTTAESFIVERQQPADDSLGSLYHVRWGHD